MIRKILSKIGLALEKDYTEADCAWVSTLNHISYYLFNKRTSKDILKNLTELLVLVDPDGNELINTWMEEWKTKNCKKVELARLNVICPMIIKAQKKLNKESLGEK